MASRPPATGRLGYLDWARGFCVLLMLHTHAFYAWVSPGAQGHWLYRKTVLIGGFPGAVFLFISGLVLALACESSVRKGTLGKARLRQGVLRGLEVLGYAFAFRFWMLATSHFGEPRDFLRVDILNCIGVSLLFLALASFGWGSWGARLLSGLLLTAVLVLFAPLTWHGPWLTGAPDALEGYWNGTLAGAFFPVLPWGAFAAAGGVTGLVLSEARRSGREGTFILGCGALGVVATCLGLLVDRHAPALYPWQDFWHTAPSYWLIKLGVVLLVLVAAYGFDRLPGPSALRQFGRTSLLVYWVHLEILYGKYVLPGVRGQLDVPQAAGGVLLLVLAMLALSLLRTHLPKWRPRADDALRRT